MALACSLIRLQRTHHALIEEISGPLYHADRFEQRHGDKRHGTSASGVLQLLLGAVVLYGGLCSALQPTPLQRRSDDRSFFVSGVFGGLLSDLFGVSGPPLVFQFYRQPLTLVQIRCALLLTFAITKIAAMCEGVACFSLANA
ncbi:hypothetical protein PPGU19_086830 (plasmid) [Paraburkholderia sp. PGU19]|nr:hypothetical protein PPGU19_086830 [Paraburkholderia sp. PGU19]